MGVPVDSTRWGVSDAGCVLELTREQRMGVLGNAFQPLSRVHATRPRDCRARGAHGLTGSFRQDVVDAAFGNSVRATLTAVNCPS